jgi:hypothetical protein
MQYLAKATETIFDVALANDIPIDIIMQVCNDNDISIDDSFTSLEINASLVSIVLPSEIVADDLTELPTTGSITVSNGQSIFDVALMAHGNLDNVFKIVKENNLSSINAYLKPRRNITYKISEIVDTKIRALIEVNKWVFNTSDPIIISGKSFDSSFNNSFQ